MKLKDVIEKSDTLAGRAFDYFIQGLIVFSLLTFAFGTLPDLKPQTRSVLHWIEVVTVAIFTTEYLLRILVADRKLGYIFSFFGLIDLAAILPFYVATGLDLRSIRVIRLFRLFRTLKIIRYNKALQRFHRALIIAREELFLFAFAACILLYLSSVGIYYFENPKQPEAFASVFHSMWWAVCTLTTVGYGDVYPITAGGRIFTFFVLMIGLGLISVPAGIVASVLGKARQEEISGESG